MSEHVLKGPWSHSRVTSCPRVLYLEKVVKAPPEPRPERFLDIDRRDFGSVLHEGAEIMLKSMMKGPWPNTRDLSQKLLKSYLHLSPMASEIERRLTLFADRFRCDWDMDVLERDAIIRQRMLGSEMRLAVDGQGGPCNFDDCPDDGFRGIVDYAEAHDDNLMIIDFKNRPGIYPLGEMRALTQLLGYAHLVRCHYPQFEKVIIGIYYLEFGYLQTAEVEVADIDAGFESLMAQARVKESMSKDDIGPEPGHGKCQYCDYLASCEAGTEYTAGGRLMVLDADSAKKLAEWTMVTDEKVKAARKSLQAFTAENGPVVLDDKTQVGYCRPKEGWDYDKDKTLGAINKLIKDGVVKGRALREFSSLNLTAVKDLARRQEVDDALASARSHRVETKFEFFRPTSKTGTTKAKKKGADKTATTTSTPRQTSGRVRRKS